MESQSIRLLRLPEVISTTGLSRASIYKFISAGKFPAPVSITDRAVAWPSDAVNQWVTSRIEAARKPASA
nr:AlpA family transcriptional regulator [Caballeronia sordidicola]